MVAWGEQVDVRRVNSAGGELTDGKVAAYLAKYATRATEATGRCGPGWTSKKSSPPSASRAGTTISCCTSLLYKIEKGRLRLAETAFELGWS
ncbi:replication initiator [Micromonospora zhanjiangensis]|uniref:Replication initiator n=1 Tax=Micromonospora zhanjiangensis TaxID=1522057 RepID=A0ABV8KF51_9ACTN